MKKFFLLVLLGFGFNVWAQNEGLISAIEMDDVSKIKKLVNSGRISVDEKVGNDEPIILVAARAGSEKVANFLISRNVNVNAQNSVKETALMMAVFFADADADDGAHVVHDRMAKTLVEAGAHLENEGWWAPLAYAAYAGRLEIARYLVQHGALVDGIVVDKVTLVNTPLMMASLQGHDKFVRYLLRQGADANLKNKNEATAYSLAEKSNNKHLLKYLSCAMNLSSGETYIDKCE